METITIAGKDFNANFVITKRKRKGKKTTYYIGKTVEDRKKEIIKEHFEKIRDAFELNDAKIELFRQATSGRGNEWMEINQLNSSTLLAFLCFHKINIDCPFIYKGTKYTDVLFEVESPIKNKRTPSSMDIVILTEDGKKALFLESKFTEYLSSPKPKSCAGYQQDYIKIFGAKLDCECGFNIFVKDGEWTIEPKQKVYFEGLKQMVCHYLGITHCLPNKLWGNPKLSNIEEITLGEILYKFEGDMFKRYGAAYKALASKLASKLDEHVKERIKILPEVLTYQDIVADKNPDILSPKVREFYFSK